MGIKANSGLLLVLLWTALSWADSDYKLMRDLTHGDAHIRDLNTDRLQVVANEARRGKINRRLPKGHNVYWHGGRLSFRSRKIKQNTENFLHRRISIVADDPRLIGGVDLGWFINNVFRQGMTESEARQLMDEYCVLCDGQPQVVYQGYERMHRYSDGYYELVFPAERHCARSRGGFTTGMQQSVAPTGMT